MVCLDISFILPLDYYSSYKYYVQYNIMYNWGNVVIQFCNSHARRDLTLGQARDMSVWADSFSSLPLPNFD